LFLIFAVIDMLHIFKLPEKSLRYPFWLVEWTSLVILMSCYS